MGRTPWPWRSIELAQARSVKILSLILAAVLRARSITCVEWMDPWMRLMNSIYIRRRAEVRWCLTDLLCVYARSCENKQN